MEASRKHSKLDTHSDFLKKPIWKKKIEDIFEQLFIEKNENTELRELRSRTADISEVVLQRLPSINVLGGFERLYFR